MTSPNPVLVILAAGESKRMGSPKGLLAVGPITLLEFHLRQFLKSGGQEAVVVLGADAPLYFERLPFLRNALTQWTKLWRLNLKVVVNHQAQLGSFSSMRMGLDAVKEGLPCFIMPIDGLGVESKTMAEMRKQLRGELAALVPIYKGKKGHPVLLSPEMVQRLKGFSPSDAGSRLDWILRDLDPGQVHVVETDNEGATINFNTPASWVEVQSRFKPLFAGFLGLVLLLMTTPVMSASKEFVVTGTKSRVLKEHQTETVSILSDQKIEDQKALETRDVIGLLPGVDSSSAGNSFAPSSLFIRGANSEHTLILIDGIPVNDPSLVGRNYNLTNLPPFAIERIEVVRGPQSVLYGSDAIGGVVQIFTTRGRGKLRTKIGFEGGSYETYSEQAQLSGSSSSFHYSLSGRQLDSKGLSIAENEHETAEVDPFSQTSFIGRVGYDQGHGFRVDLTTRFNRTGSHLDQSGVRNGDDPNYKSTEYERLIGIQVEKDWSESVYSKLITARVSHQRATLDERDDLHPNELTADYFGVRDFVELQTGVRHGDHLVTLGSSYQEDRVDVEVLSGFEGQTFRTSLSNEIDRSQGYFIQEELRFSRLFLTFGLRRDHQADADSVTTGRGGFKYWLWPGVFAVKSNYGTGYKSPTAYQKYSQYGRKDLRPESSRSWEMGGVLGLGNGRFSLELNVFRTLFRDLIDFDFIESRYQNTHQADIRGFESVLLLRPSFSYELSTNYTVLGTKDDRQRPLLRRAERKLATQLSLRSVPDWIFSLQHLYKGKRYDLDPNDVGGGRLVLPAYSLFRLMTSYFARDDIEIYGKVENLFDHKYQESAGYQQAGRSYYAGLKLVF